MRTRWEMDLLEKGRLEIKEFPKEDESVVLHPGQVLKLGKDEAPRYYPGSIERMMLSEAMVQDDLYAEAWERRKANQTIEAYEQGWCL